MPCVCTTFLIARDAMEIPATLYVDSTELHVSRRVYLVLFQMLASLAATARYAPIRNAVTRRPKLANPACMPGCICWGSMGPGACP